MSIVQETLIYRFADFTLDVRNRELLQQEERLDLNARYFDALILLVREHGRLVEKDRFFEEVWDDVVVSDSALTQCIKEIRRLLRDDASNPRFIQTVPRHGYRFIAEVSIAERRAAGGASGARTETRTHQPPHWRDSPVFRTHAPVLRKHPPALRRRSPYIGTR